MRIERHFDIGSWRALWYAERLNATNAQNVFATVYDTGDVPSGTLPEQSTFNHLPIRPFLGLRVEL